MEASTANEKELQIQTDDLPNDFPEFYDTEKFLKAKYWVARHKSSGEILGGIGLRPDGDGNHHIEWLNGFAVKSTARK